ncbi:MAG TPA: transketolase [Chlamydiales bacterium]|nr:transketolase [Chlamydiales bacterium]
MDNELKKILGKIAGTVKGLSMDAVQKANSGHPGMPMGCAEIGAYLWGHLLKYNPEDTRWVARDRVILSAGHGSMWLYSFLHLAGYKITMEDIKNFRQLHSVTPGHPEYHITHGVEATTGPLGQGVGNAVGLALAYKILAEKFNTKEHTLFKNKIFCVAGDGCLMEGVGSEASSFAGHLNLNNLVLIYDSNNICLDGPTSECFTEDTKARYKAYGFDVYEMDAYDFDQIDKVFSEIQKNQSKPVLIVAHTIIGKGSPNKAGTHHAHGSPLGEEEVKLSKKELGLPEENFYVPHEVTEFFKKRKAIGANLEKEWHDLYRNWAKANTGLAKEFEQMKNKTLPENLEDELCKIPMKTPLAGRVASQNVLGYLGKVLPFIYGGSADLSGSDMTMMKEFPIIKTGDFKGRNLKFGVREFAMGTIVNGMSCTDMIQPYCGTFFTFSDYMRNSIRLAALSGYHVIYQFTHDSIFLGEDGPTHQPIEQLASLRAMPNLHVIRPADNLEVKMSWIAALGYKGPTALVLTRQNLPELTGTKVPYKDGVGRGAYIVKKESKGVDVVLIATGSEVWLAIDVATKLASMGKSVRVVSMPCWELFDKQPEEYKKNLLPKTAKKVSIEAASDFGWSKYIGPEGISIHIDGFGHSAPMADLQKEFGFTVDAIVDKVIRS